MSCLPAQVHFFLGCVFLHWFMITQRVSAQKTAYFIQPDDITNGTYDDLSKNGPEICARVCKSSEPPKKCYYRFVLEAYDTLSEACRKCPGFDLDCFLPQCIPADGVERGILTVNRRLPGPSIQVCQGDIIVVDVKNKMPGRSTTLHWHGIRQFGTPYMDGVPMITQCPIEEEQIFRYKFVAENAGTHFWHSHDGMQKMDGIIGSIVVRRPRELDPNRALYRFDLPSHIALVTDWMHTDADERFPGFIHHDFGQTPDTYLINGQGDFAKLFASTNTPLATFSVEKGNKYLLRFIGGTCLSCAVQVTVENHPLLLVATDGTPVEPVSVNSFNLYPGDRYDFVLHANKWSGTFWIHAKGLGSCSKATQVGVLKYAKSAYIIPRSPRPTVTGFNAGKVLNPELLRCEDPTEGVCLSDLQSKELPDERLFALHPHSRILVTIGLHVYKDEEVFGRNSYPRYFNPITATPMAGWINNISNVMPPAPLLTQLEDIPLSVFCSEKCLNPPDNAVPCQCTNLIKISRNRTIELIIVDPAPANIILSHPMHLHGFNFNILAEGKFNPKISISANVKELQRKLLKGTFLNRRPTSKDTINVPPFGYVVVRFIADNPGYWFFHCHFLYHHISGMSATVQVGEHADMPQPPPNFQRCGDFLIPIDKK